MSLALRPDPSSLFSAAQFAAAFQWAWTCRLLHPFSAKSQIPRALELCGPFLHRAHSQLSSHAQPPVPSSHRRHARCRVAASLPGASLAGPEASPHSAWAVLELRALFPGGACPLMVIVVRLAVVPTRLQPAPVNSLSVNW